MAIIAGNSNGVFLTTKGGNFYLSTDKELSNPFRTVTGSISEMKYRIETFNGAETEKLYISITDGNETFKLGLNTDNANYGKMIGFLKNADLSKPLEISVNGGPNPKNPEKILHNFFVGQNGSTMKSAYPKGSLPEWKKVRLNGKDVYDKEAYMTELKRIVEQELIPQFSSDSQSSNNQEDSSENLPF